MTTEQGSSKWENMANEALTEDAVSADAIEGNVLPKEESEADELNEKVSESSIEHADYETLQKKLTESENLAHENWEKAVRATAEADNIRRRAEKDIQSAHKYGNEKFVKSLLPVIDSLEQALQANTSADESEISALKEGIELTIKLFVDALNKANVAQIDPVGEVFDPQRHEAMSMQDAPEAKPGTVLMVFQKGYLLNERVIRPARVVVVKGKPAQVNEEV
jgi:molecular chaperone GrpE